MEETRISKKNGKRGRKRQRSEDRYQCSSCLYTSQRLFNIIRHESRIHSMLSRKRQCCGMIFTTKGDYYLHCEECHPESRANRISRKKYKILAGSKILRDSTDSNMTNESVTEEENSENFTRAPYILRSGVREMKKIEDKNKENEEREVSECERNFDDPTIEKNSTIMKSSGYETNTSSSSSSSPINSSLDSNERDFLPIFTTSDTANVRSLKTDMEASSSSEIDRSNEQKMSITNDENVVKVTEKQLDESRICTGEQNDDSGIENRSSSTDTVPVNNCCETNVHNLDESLNLKSPSLNDVNTRRYFDFGNLMTPALAVLPIKKRILHQLASYNRENHPETRKTFADRLYRSSKSKTRISVKSRKKFRMMKKKIHWRGRGKPKSDKSDRYSSTASSDTENVSPIVREQKSLLGEVDLRIDPRIIWQDVTRLQRDYLRAIDFDSLTKYR